MGDEANEKINALGVQIGVSSTGTRDDYISLTDIARYKSDEPKMVIQNWMRNRNTIEFLGVWEGLHNPDFKGIEFDAFRKEAGLNSFTMTPTKWISATNAKGVKVKRGHGGGTYAHVDIAFEFASWISPEFKLYVIKDYQRLSYDSLPNKRLLKLFPLMTAVLSKAAAIAGTDSGTKTARNRLERQQKAPAGAGAQG